ncbi:hypothetical protein T06_58 [Trichinella sp. T6]|nr:hypothetical protein T06_58 [Trichinella sp. T6]
MFFLHFTTTSDYVHFVRVHIPTYQPPVEYEQADVSTANCIQRIKKGNILQKLNFTVIIQTYVQVLRLYPRLIQP